MNFKGSETFRSDIASSPRYQRGFSKIEDLIGKVQAGKVIDENDIPVSIRAIRSVELHAKKADTSIISEPEVIFYS